MTKRSTTAEAETTQDQPTASWPVDEAGRPLDRHGLPLNGPARAAALAERGVEDPETVEPQASPSTDTASQPDDLSATQE